MPSKEDKRKLAMRVEQFRQETISGIKGEKGYVSANDFLLKVCTQTLGGIIKSERELAEIEASIRTGVYNLVTGERRTDRP